MYRSYGEDEPHNEEECYSYQEHKEEKEEAKFWLKHVLAQLYSKCALDLVELEDALQELCATLGVTIPEKSIAIQRKPEVTFDQWPQWNAEYLKKLAN